jgi:beta-ribofuranosylaminobenzene 5'-phosphate synthase
MTTHLVQVTAPARMHFGMLSFGDNRSRQFGGIGIMVERPETKLKFSRAQHFQVSGPQAARARRFAETWSRWQELDSLPQCHIEISACPEPHTGVGSGTQLGLAVAAGLQAWILPQAAPLSADELATSVGRARRSAVGSYGFVMGGLIFESGRHSGEMMAPLQRRVAVPDSWRFLLLTPGDSEGLSGSAEKDAFAALPPVPDETTRELVHLARDVIVPATGAGRFDEFAEALHDYNSLAGSCFSKIQGSAFGGPRLQSLVEELRSWGVRGVGQSSWGPTVFAVLPDETAARQVANRIGKKYTEKELRCMTAAPNNTGATIETI